MAILKILANDFVLRPDPNTGVVTKVTVGVGDGGFLEAPSMAIGPPGPGGGRGRQLPWSSPGSEVVASLARATVCIPAPNNAGNRNEEVSTFGDDDGIEAKLKGAGLPLRSSAANERASGLVPLRGGW